jgi:hypothetical protein
LNRDQKIVGIIFISIFSAMFFLAKRSENKERESISKYGTYTIAKVVKIARTRSVNHAYYYFYYNNNRYDDVERFNGMGDEYVNNFYVVKFSSKEPKYSNLDLSGQITDTAKIKKIGYIIN